MRIHLTLKPSLPAPLALPGRILQNCASADERKAEVRAPSNYKDEVKIAEFIASAGRRLTTKSKQKQRKQYRATALDGTFWRGVLCGVGY